MATSQVAVNKIFNARDEGRTIPEGWGVDEQGRTTTDPGKVYAAVPLGGYKGYALALLVEVLSGVLSGSGVGHGIGRIYEGETPGRRALPPRHRRRAPGRPRARRASCSPGCSATSRRSRPRPASTRCSSPASRRQRTQAERERDGIPLPPTLWTTLGELSASSASPCRHRIAVRCGRSSRLRAMPSPSGWRCISLARLVELLARNARSTGLPASSSARS